MFEKIKKADYLTEYSKDNNFLERIVEINNGYTEGESLLEINTISNKNLVNLDTPTLQKSKTPYSNKNRLALNLDNNTITNFKYLNEKNNSSNFHYNEFKLIQEKINTSILSQKKWEKVTNFNKCKILYNFTEILEKKRNFFVYELLQLGFSKELAEAEIDFCIDRIFYFAGWCDKYQQIFNTVNSYTQNYFSHSIYEATGVVSIVTSADSPLLCFVGAVVACLVGGNSCIVYVTNNHIELANYFIQLLENDENTKGLINIFSIDKLQFIKITASNLDIRSIIYYGENFNEMKIIEEYATSNMKKIVMRNNFDFFSNKQNENPYLILDTLESKSIRTNF